MCQISVMLSMVTYCVIHLFTLCIVGSCTCHVLVASISIQFIHVRIINAPIFARLMYLSLILYFQLCDVFPFAVSVFNISAI
jgi:hypothetical protein